MARLFEYCSSPIGETVCFAGILFVTNFVVFALGVSQ